MSDPFVLPLGENKNPPMSVRVLVMNRVPPTPGQLGELDHRFRLHKLNLAASGGVYLTRDGALRDGSQFRLVSNMGHHDLMVWPVATGGSQPIVLGGFQLLPHDDLVPEGWDEDIMANPITPQALLEAGATLPLPPVITLHTKLQAGPVNWLGPNGVILSWDHGGSNRYSTNLWDIIISQDFFGYSITPLDGIYYRGTKINTSFGGVSAAGIYDGRLVAITGDLVYEAPSPLGNIDDALAKGALLPSVTPTWTSVTVTGSVSDAQKCSAWHFKPDGSVAACAVVYDSYGVGTWTYLRACTEELPQAKRYITFGMVDGNVTAAVSDVAFIGEAMANKVGGTLLESTLSGGGGVWGIATAASFGALTYHGKRLLGIDFAEDGTEILLTLRRSGSGTSSQVIVPPTGPFTFDGTTTTTLGFDQKWGLYANEDELVSARSFLPTITYFWNQAGTDTCTQTGGDLFEANYMTMGQIDARVGMAVVERVKLVAEASLSVPSAGTIPTPAYSTQIMTVTASVEVWADNALVDQTLVTIPAGREPSVRVNLDIFNAHAKFIRNGFFYRSTNPSLTGVVNNGDTASAPLFPQGPGWLNENVYEHYFANSTATTRIAVRHTTQYPNQVSDVLMHLYGIFYESLSQVSWDFRFSDDYTERVGWDSTYNDIHNQPKIARGLGVRHYDPGYFVVASRNTFTWEFFNTLIRREEVELGITEVGIEPTHAADAFIYDEDTLTWDVTDLLEPFADKVDAEVGALTVDRATFGLEPVHTI